MTAASKSSWASQAHAFQQFDIQIVAKQLTERDCREWKLSAIDPHHRDAWRSGVRSAMLAGGSLLWILPLYLHVNEKSNDDDDESPSSLDNLHVCI